MFAVITFKSFHREFCSKAADGMANSVYPDLTASLKEQPGQHLLCYRVSVCQGLSV